MTTRAEGVAVDLGLAAPVGPTLQRVGQRLLVEALGIGQHVGDAHDAKAVVVELEQVVRGKNAAQAGLNDRPGRSDVDPSILRDPLGGFFDGRFSFWLCRLLGRRDQRIEPPLLIGAQRRACGKRVEKLSLDAPPAGGHRDPARAAPDDQRRAFER